MAVQDPWANTMSSYQSNSNSTDEEGTAPRGRRIEEQLDHPTLNALRAQARKDAEQTHARKAPKVVRKAGKKKKSSRTISNIRSAEISRETRAQYIKLMEEQIHLEEQKWCDVLSDMLDLTRKNIELQRKIDARKSANKRPRTEPLSGLLPGEMDGLEGFRFPEWNSGDAEMNDVHVGDWSGCWEARRTDIVRGDSVWQREKRAVAAAKKDAGSPVTVFRTAQACSPKRHSPKVRAASPRSVRL